MSCGLSLLITPGDGKCREYRRSGSDTCRYCDDLKTAEVAEMAAKSKRVAKKCSVKGCDKSAQHGCDGMCKAHFRDACTEAGVTPKTADTPPVSESALADIDPRNTYQCPHCTAVLSTDEAQLQDCPVCKQQMRYPDTKKDMDLFVSANEIREEMSAEQADLPSGPVTIPSAIYPDLDADAAEVSAGFGKVTNVYGDSVSFGVVDDLLLQLIDHILRDVRHALLVDVSGMSVTAGARHVLRAVEGMAVRAAL